MARKRNDAKYVEVIDAFIESVVEVGLQASTMAEVGKRVGLDRSTMHHYFKARDELVLAAAVRIKSLYLDRLKEAMEGLEMRDGHALVEYLYGPHFHRADLSVAIGEFWTAGERNPAILHAVSSMYGALEAAIVEEIGRNYPTKPKSLRKQTAYALAHLTEGSSVYFALGYDRRTAAKKASIALLDILKKA